MKIRKVKKMKRKKFAAILGTCGLVSCMGVASLAYFTDSESVTNTFTTGDLDITETEPSWDDTSDGKNIYPGYTVVKDLTISNVTAKENNSAYVRAIVTYEDSQGNTLTDQDAIGLINKTIRYSSDGTITEGTKYSLSALESVPNYNGDFTLDSGRSTTGSYVYNYNSTIAADKSVVLFNRIVIPSDWTQTELNKVGDFNIEVKIEAIQANGFSSASDAFTALDSEKSAKTIQSEYKTVAGVAPTT